MRTKEEIKKKTANMTEGRPLRLMITFMLPVIGTNIMQQIYAMADSISVGQGVGGEALAAIGTTDWLRNGVMWTILGLCDGFAILTAIAFGRRDDRQTADSIVNILILGAAIGVILSVAGFVFTKPLLLLIGTEEVIMDKACIYLQISYAGSAFVMMFNAGSSVLKSLGDSRTPFYAMILSSVVNILLDLVAVFVLKWGITGAAVATVLAQLIAGIYCAATLWKLPVMGYMSEMKPNIRLMKNLMAKGVPMAADMAILAVGGVILQSVINRAGFDYVAAFAATNKMILIYEGIAIALGSAMLTYVGQNYGAGRFDRIREGMKTALVISAVVSAVLGAVLVLFGRYLMIPFIERDAPSFENIVQLGGWYFTIIGLGLFSLYALHIYRQSLMGLGNTIWPLLSGAGEFAGRVGTATVLVWLIGYRALLGAEVAAFILADLFLVVPYYMVLRNREREHNYYAKK